MKNGAKISKISKIVEGGKKLGGGDNSPNPSRLRDLRKSKGFSLTEVAQAAGIPYRKLVEIEGRRSPLSGRLAVRLAAVLGSDAFDLLVLRYAEETGDLLAHARANDAENSIEYRQLRDALTARFRERVADARRHGWAPTESGYPGAVEMVLLDTKIASNEDELVRLVDSGRVAGQEPVGDRVVAVYLLPEDS